MLKGVIYRIHSPSRPNLGQYIGSTFLGARRRWAIHRCAYRSFLLGRGRFCAVYKVMGACIDAEIEILEEIEVENRGELLRLEGNLIRSLPGVVNLNIAGRTDRERYDDNRQQNQEKAKNYYYVNIEKRKDYYQMNKARLIAKSKARYWTRRFQQLSEIST